ncbi:MAG: chromosomal replication initiator protein DnaA [Armatimonadetes bacterium]|nr:chromosomal replication initiator protein DnaA [Armatimonadota bacterium]
MSDKQLQLGEDDSHLALRAAWEQALEVLSGQVNRPSFESWIKTARPVSIEDGLVRITTNSRFAKHWLESKHLALIKEILETHLDCPIRIRVDLVEDAEPVIMADKLPKKPSPRPKPDDDPISLPLNNQYNFESFVVGPTNRLAHACAMAIADSPGRTYNPLFIYGGAGLGKTHLMHAVGQCVVANLPEMRVAYVSGEAFTYHYITALREHRTAEFRRKYRSIDLWLVDDIQFLVGKERTEEEFFHTYNAIYDMGKQIVLTSDRAPKDLELDGRLLSRFQCGMLADISPPDLETRMAILQSKAACEHMTLSDEVILYIAKLIRTNIRQLEGALITLHAYASLMKTSVTPTLAEEVLSKHFGGEAAPVIDAQKVLQHVARRFNVEISEIKGKCRGKDIVAPRQIAMYLMRELTEYSLPAIGKAMGGKDHTTVIHSCKKVEEKALKDKSFATLMGELSRAISDGKSC